jgi:uncharacterized membrane protein YwaF
MGSDEMVFQEQGIAIILMTTLAVISIFLVFRYIDRISRYKKYIDFFLLLYALESMIRHYIMWTLRGQYYNYIPLQVCYFTMFIYIYYYFTNNRKMLPFLHIFGFLGIAALIAPGHQFSFTNPLSYIFMVDHIVLAVMPFYIIVAHKYYPEYRSIKVLLYTFVPFFVIGILLSQYINVNQLWGATGEQVQTWTNEANYFFLIKNPITGYTINPWLIALFQLIGMVLFGYFATYLGQYINQKVYQLKENTT